MRNEVQASAQQQVERFAAIDAETEALRNAKTEQMARVAEAEARLAEQQAAQQKLETEFAQAEAELQKLSSEALEINSQIEQIRVAQQEQAKQIEDARAALQAQELAHQRAEAEAQVCARTGTKTRRAKRNRQATGGRKPSSGMRMKRPSRRKSTRPASNSQMLEVPSTSNAQRSKSCAAKSNPSRLRLNRSDSLSRILLKRIVAVEGVFVEQRKTHQLTLAQARLQEERREAKSRTRRD